MLMMLLKMPCSLLEKYQAPLRCQHTALGAIRLL